jgi:hypothetical protein
MPIQMPDGSEAIPSAPFIRHGGKRYRHRDGAFPQTVLVRGEFDHAGMLIAEDEAQNRFGFIEASTVEIRMHNGGTAKYIEGDVGVLYGGEFYRGHEDAAIFTAEASSGCVEKDPSVLVISTQVGGGLEHIYFYKI